MKKQLALREETLKDVSEKIEISYSYTRRLACGQVEIQKGIDLISDYLGIEPYEVADGQV